MYPMLIIRNKLDTICMHISHYIFYKQSTPASHACLLWFKMTDISLISLNMRNNLQQKHIKFRENSSIFMRFITQTTIQDFDVALKKLSNFNC